MDGDSKLEERVKKISNKLKCAPSAPRYKRCKDNEAEFVCHECGSPLCRECYIEVKGREFYYYKSALPHILIAFSILILLPLFTALLSNVVYQINIIGGLFAAIILFIALISPVEILRRKAFNENGKLITSIKIVRKELTEAIHCRKCIDHHKNQSYLVIAFAVIGILFIMLGLYNLIQGFVHGTSINGAVILIAFGFAIFHSRYFLMDISAEYIPRLLRLNDTSND